MKLDIYKSEIGKGLPSYSWDWLTESEANQFSQELQPSTWVKLSEPPSSFCFEEALLLCQCSADLWLAWIPDYGEAVLHRSQFC
ncbi:hypothetical protein NIES2119_18970 [[Phormidium ambiguum] IAM M-71]|uniref:Uncharacterized protein n=2 Tax=[Phormidium ambiguum] IAM M-71 TaxID=454136 RepID=A0A1U7IFR9_9CYAN|nr:hypothetical protein NIES2119_18970 [Phormidium ambiguum IAM M-71]